MDIMQAIVDLETEMTDKKGLFSKKVNVERCVDIIRALKTAVPESIREAEYVVAKRDSILSNADNVAQNTIREAEERADHIVENSELVKKAEIEQRRIIDQAYMQCDTLVSHTKRHLDDMFKDIEQFLLQTLAMIRNNREELNGALIMSPKNNQ